MMIVSRRLLCSGVASAEALPRRMLSAASLRRSHFIPSHSEASEEALSDLQRFVSASERLLVLTGAGCSTESGIPDYRSEGVGLYARSDKRPIQHKTFMANAKARQSYWARNFVGWRVWSGVRPNAAHAALAAWEREGRTHHLVTQNVDQLHFKAGSNKVVELHGTNSLVKCMTCSYTVTRMAFQKVLEELNPEFKHRIITEIRPDGDVELPASEVSAFRVPDCPRCGNGILKPDVVFFGDNVPRERVEAVRSLVSEADAMLVVGSSLFVFSGYRFVLQSKEQGRAWNRAFREICLLLFISFPYRRRFSPIGFPMLAF